MQPVITRRMKTLVHRNVTCADGKRTSVRLTSVEWAAIAEVVQTPSLSQIKTINGFVREVDRRHPNEGLTVAVRNELISKLLVGWRKARAENTQNAVNEETAASAVQSTQQKSRLINRNIASADGRPTSVRLTSGEWDALTQVAHTPGLTERKAISAFVKIAEKERPDERRTEAVRNELISKLLVGWRVARVDTTQTDPLSGGFSSSPTVMDFGKQPPPSPTPQ
jgi:predicted DNA-binding ribbon-helix-helix protein